MAKTLTSVSRVPKTGALNNSKKKRRFKDPRLRWMDELLSSFHGPAPESWLPASYRYLYRQKRTAKRPVH